VKKRIVLMALGLLVAVGIVVGWLLRLQEPSLLSKAMRLNISGGLRTDYYTWLPNHQLLLIRKDGLADRVNLASGTRTPISDLNRPLKQYRIIRRDPADGLQYAEVSPDTKWLFWRETVQPYGLHLASIMDGSTQPIQAGADTNMGDPCWLPDGRHWTVVSSPRNGPPVLLTYKLGQAKPISRVNLPPHLWSNRLLGTTPDGRLVFADLWLATNRPGLFTLSIHKGKPDITDQPLEVPDDSAVIDVTMSPITAPHGPRMAYIVERRSRPSSIGILQRLFDWIGRKRKNRVELYTSRVDGTSMRKVGSLSYDDPKDALTALRWTPDGKRLSFVHHDTLWTVPVD
jgi:hypothetical protein